MITTMVHRRHVHSDRDCFRTGEGTIHVGAKLSMPKSISQQEMLVMLTACEKHSTVTAKQFPTNNIFTVLSFSQKFTIQPSTHRTIRNPAYVWTQVDPLSLY